MACSTWGTRDRERDWTKGFRHCLHSTRDNRPGQDWPWEVVKGLRWPILRSQAGVCWTVELWVESWPQLGKTSGEGRGPTFSGDSGLTQSHF